MVRDARRAARDRVPYLPFRRLIRARGDRRGGRLDRGTSIAAFVGRIAPDLVQWLPLVADVIGAEVPMTPEVEALDAAFRSDRLRLAVAELVLALTGHGAVIVFEDVHWIDEASRALVEVLIGMLGNQLCLVVTRRPEGWSPTPATTIELSAIDSEFADQLLLRELPPSAASDATLSRLRASAAGNPLYLIELARSVASTSTRSGEAFPESVERCWRHDRPAPVSGRELIRDARCSARR
jgi:predicted ATPase